MQPYPLHLRPSLAIHLLPSCYLSHLTCCCLLPHLQLGLGKHGKYPVGLHSGQLAANQYVRYFERRKRVW